MILTGTTVLADLTANSATNFRNIILGLIGTFAIVVLAARSLGAFADERYGKMVTLIISAVPVFGFCYFPDQTVSVLKGLFTTFTG
ncbi:MAG: hypothetical protein ACRDQY_17790 [Pseudonocardiaceae bacterium]